MERYDYEKAIKEDIREYIAENYGNDLPDFDDLYDELWIADEVTGNGSGSYHCNAYEAEEALAYNWRLIMDVAREYRIKEMHGAEWWDTAIRTYLLYDCLMDVYKEKGVEV